MLDGLREAVLQWHRRLSLQQLSRRGNVRLAWLRIILRFAKRADDVCFANAMIADIRHFLETRPFEPFVIVTSNGHRYRVPSVDPVGTNPQGNRIVVWFDDDSSATLSGLHITALEKEAQRAA